MTEKGINKENLYGWGLTFDLTDKIPAINKRIFDKLVDAQQYADDFSDSAVAGLLLSVTADDEKKNGVYFVQTIKKQADDEKAKLQKLSFGDLEEAVTYIDNQIATIKAQIGEIEEGKTVIDFINTVMEEVRANKETIDAYTINNKVISESPVLNSDDLSMSETYSTLEQPGDFITPGDIITTAISKIEVMLANTTLALTAAITDVELRLGRPSEKDAEGNVISEASGLYKKYEDLEKLINNQ
jgi:hypothetical protein